MPDEKVRENRLRRMAARQGLQLIKSRRRDPRAIDYGGYMLIEAHNNTIVLGATPTPYCANVDDVEKFLTEDDK